MFEYILAVGKFNFKIACIVDVYLYLLSCTQIFIFRLAIIFASQINVVCIVLTVLKYTN